MKKVACFKQQKFLLILLVTTARDAQRRGALKGGCILRLVYIDPDAMFVLNDSFLTVAQASLQAFLLK